MAACGTCPKCESMLVFSGPKSFCLLPGRNSLWPKLLRKKLLLPILSRNHGYTPKKYLNIYLKNHYTTVLNLFFELTDSSKYSIFRYHHALHGQLILHQMSQHLATLQTSLFKWPNFDCSSGHRKK